VGFIQSTKGDIVEAYVHYADHSSVRSIIIAPRFPALQSAPSLCGFHGGKGWPKRINHFMLECNSLIDVGIGRGLCTERGVPIGIDLGCHRNDRMVSFYLANPSGFAVEYGWGGRIIDDNVWQIEHYDSVESVWGHPQLKAMVASMAAAAARSGQ
jgi:hypothetical protein